MTSIEAPTRVGRALAAALRSVNGQQRRVEIQGLRALAVTLVVVYHVMPQRLPGGYIGVDVFFVVSGFLITGHLARELEQHGRISFGRFWARRARRLLPAALLVLLASAIATFVWVPATLWEQFLREITAAALYVENWQLAGDAVDYLAADNTASLSQHYWSLSTEEQFYLVWPLLIAGTAWVALRVGRSRSRTVVAVLGVVVVASLAYSLWATWNAPSLAYFSTMSRAWEFGAGALLALLRPDVPKGRARLRSALSWCGFLLIALAAFTLDGGTPFPGVAALLPVIGTLLVISVGAPAGPWSPARLAEFGPIHLIGDISYSVYLWHWPLVVLAPFILGHPIGPTSAIGIIAVTLVLAWNTTVFVEDPVRTVPALARRRARRTFLLAAVATAAVVAVAVSGTTLQRAGTAEARTEAARLLSTHAPCFGAGAMSGDGSCSDPFRTTSTANPLFAKEDRSQGLSCLAAPDAVEVRECDFPAKGATTTVALIGDSHAASWLEPLLRVAAERRWNVEVFVHVACPVLDTDGIGLPWWTSAESEVCGAWSRTLLERLATDGAVSMVLTSYRSDLYRYTDGGPSQAEIPAEVVQRSYEPLLAAGKQVVVLRSVPATDLAQGALATSIPTCIEAARTDSDPCGAERVARVLPDYLQLGLAGVPGASSVDLTDAFCDAQRCHSVVGGVIVYWDDSHLTATFASTLAPMLEARLPAARG